MSSSNPPPPSPNPRNNNAPNPPSLSIQEALAKANRERFANLTSSGLPRTTIQPSPSTNAPHRFVNPRDVEQVDTTEFWHAEGETKSEKDGEFLEECRRERQKRKEKAKRAADDKKEKENASVENDAQDKVNEQVVNDDDEAELQPETASPNPEKKGENEWKYWKEIAGLPPKRSSAYRKESAGNAG